MLGFGMFLSFSLKCPCTPLTLAMMVIKGSTFHTLVCNVFVVKGLFGEFIMAICEFIELEFVGGAKVLGLVRVSLYT